ncbi:hypothetical protein RHMOL_Rhmol05G0120800 [Rhododendron molle]|uniref:Uncharacterized protein n=1 Tax=Rhododendron molle TaxID=49168 RepID=A0ACC0NN93_RHOML|nr:hypothetical protein RHMOL_Rhmol05G0120800 [Rhododendron molle]
MSSQEVFNLKRIFGVRNVDRPGIYLGASMDISSRKGSLFSRTLYRIGMKLAYFLNKVKKVVSRFLWYGYVSLPLILERSGPRLRSVEELAAEKDSTREVPGSGSRRKQRFRQPLEPSSSPLSIQIKLFDQVLRRIPIDSSRNAATPHQLTMKRKMKRVKLWESTR